MTEADLIALAKRAREHNTTPEERERQRRSFVYGQIKIGNLVVTRSLVDEVGDRMPAPKDE